jgi:uncharacterized protein
MSLRTELLEATKQAMKDRDTKKVSVLRLLMSEIKKTEIDGQAELDDVAIQKIVSQQVKRTKDAMKDFLSGGRQDLVDNAQVEIDILKTYMPDQLSDFDIEQIVLKTIETVGASGQGDMGKVMGMAMKEIKGRAEGTKVREIVTVALHT